MVWQRTVTPPTSVIIGSIPITSTKPRLTLSTLTKGRPLNDRQGVH